MFLQNRDESSQSPCLQLVGRCATVSPCRYFVLFLPKWFLGFALLRDSFLFLLVTVPLHSA